MHCTQRTIFKLRRNRNHNSMASDALAMLAPVISGAIGCDRLQEAGRAMKRADKRRAEETVEVLKRSHTAIKKMLDAKNGRGAMELLERCQTSAISLGENIEASQGEGSVTVSLLEQYCESVYQTYEKVRMSGWADGNQVHNALSGQLIQIGNSIRKDIHVQKEAVFLPYKASAWDSLESIWKAAAEDPECDAYVIPIPYYDKNPDGSLGQMHYEGSLYPKEVPMTHYGDYDFAQRRPDVIFIHNPYDNCNHLTSVHPFFYTKNLKRFTETLVYVPYFISGETDPEDEKEAERIPGFCTCPGVIYADKVIVQSEEMRQAYVHAMMKSMENHGMGRRDWEEKILDLGPVKTARAGDTAKEDAEIWKEWRKALEKES